MKKSTFMVAAAMLLSAIGCNEGNPGGPGARTPSNSQTANKPVIGEARDSFSLHTPVLSTSVKQGETKSATISIQRGTGFEDDVQISFSNLPTGITIDPMKPTLARSDKEVKVNVTAADDAAVGDFTVNLTGHPMKGGPDATNEFKLGVAAK